MSKHTEESLRKLDIEELLNIFAEEEQNDDFLYVPAQDVASETGAVAVVFNRKLAEVAYVYSMRQMVKEILELQELNEREEEEDNA